MPHLDPILLLLIASCEHETEPPSDSFFHYPFSKTISMFRSSFRPLSPILIPARRCRSQLSLSRNFHTTPSRSEFHFDTHHFVQRLEREGLNRAQAEGIMSAMAEVIDESIRNMTSNMVTKADQEKASTPGRNTRHAYALTSILTDSGFVAPLHTASRLCTAQVRAAAHGEERPRNDQS